MSKKGPKDKVGRASWTLINGGETPVTAPDPVVFPVPPGLSPSATAHYQVLIDRSRAKDIEPDALLIAQAARFYGEMVDAYAIVAKGGILVKGTRAGDFKKNPASMTFHKAWNEYKKLLVMLDLVSVDRSRRALSEMERLLLGEDAPNGDGEGPGETQG
jgi:hypothetical protein